MSNKFNFFGNTQNYEDDDLLKQETYQKNQDINFVKCKIYNINNNDNNELNEIKIFTNHLIKEYIWQKEPFNLKLINKNNNNNNNNKSLSYYYSKIKFDESIDDEWFIVYILIEISKKFKNLIISVKDNDGEFLLIETSKTLPKWVKPTNTRNRVFIMDGQLRLIPLPSNPSQLDEIPYKMDIETAITVLSTNKQINTTVSNETTKILNNKLKKFYDGEYLIEQNHISLVYLPIGVSFLLKEYPQLISSITTTFYNRDVDDMKSITTMKWFSSVVSNNTNKNINNNNNNTITNNNNNNSQYNEFIFTKIRFTRCLYAMLKLQHFNSPRNFPISLPKPSHPTYEAKSLGIKVICGLEMLYQKSKKNHEIEKQNKLNSNNPEKYNFNDDLNWLQYLKKIKSSDYFQNEKEGSKLYREKLILLKTNYLNKQHQQGQQEERNESNVDDNDSKIYLLIDKILNSLLSSKESEIVKHVETSDNELIESDEQWLNEVPDKFEDLINEFEKDGFGFADNGGSGKNKNVNKSNSNGSASNNSEEDTINNFSKSFKSMLSQLSSIDGVNIKNKKNGSQGNEGVSFDSKKFMGLLKGLASMGEDEDNQDEDFDESDDMYQDIDDYDDSDDYESDKGKSDSDTDDDDDEDYQSSSEEDDQEEFKYVEFLKKSTMKTYMKQMDKELNSKIYTNSSFEVEPTINQILTPEEIKENNIDIDINNNNTNEDDTNKKVNLDLNLVKNLLESLSEQQGLAGPASNLLREMKENKQQKEKKKAKKSSKKK
ncbi:hypothetical protein DICPUDRAFT_25982 [Dictyostelium purpureum]|uniref:Uncharacterized protein n=1 Tax=Dictyostelium purpureum TaxID=5786 RepID=F0Z7R3_DICPU|nr:uncharacterized protein DICPUDRAFT_25982 [Dictyostelium purpureum]EGC39952.1 hypothetical protein DICPUDRAFT_25982 [Dictyostelium purpureum]|eukprot:XP_003283455.1 hypothetical protein DICPUDRAFT_25982 [Dictyostelium purpureum]